MSRVDEIKERLLKSTPGPWECKKEIINDRVVRWGIRHRINGYCKSFTPVCSMSAGFYRFLEDAEFLTHCREDIVFLLSEIERLAAEIEDYERKMKD